MVVFLMTTTAALSFYYLLSGQELPGSILGNFNVYFPFRLIRVAIALNTRKTEHWQSEGGKGRTVGFH